MARDQGVDTMDPGVWAEMMRINVTGAGLMIRESLRVLTIPMPPVRLGIALWMPPRYAAIR
ncbi:hypothetical protein ACFYRG_38685 [Streptomyces mirabilis]|uniref:hypothetical protein n=1 Tax=Streptomyces mirabilis TaxID=68239 RepID=UPI0036888A98